MKTLCKILVLCLLCAVLFCGCNDKPAESEPDYSALILPPVDLSIVDCITAEELTAIMGSPMQLLGVFEDNSQAVFTSEDGTHVVTVNMKNQTSAGFEAEKNASLFSTTLQDGVGEMAYWCEDTETDNVWLEFYSGGYAVTVGVTCPETDDQAHSTYIKQIAEKILGKLPTDTQN